MDENKEITIVLAHLLSIGVSKMFVDCPKNLLNVDCPKNLLNLDFDKIYKRKTFYCHTQKLEI